MFNHFTLLLLLCITFLSAGLSASIDYILCLDGGGSKTVLQVLDANKQLLQVTQNGQSSDHALSSGSNINTVGLEGVAQSFQNLFQGTQVDGKLVTEILDRSELIAGMAGVGNLKNKQAVLALLQQIGFKPDQILLMTDAELALKIVGDPGIMLIAGTGSICFGKKDEKNFRIGGLGPILGDEGSGYRMGLEAIKAGIEEECGWGQPTELTSALREFYHVSELKSLIPAINLREMTTAQIASAAPLVFDKASQQDCVATSILTQTTDQLAEMVSEIVSMAEMTSGELHLWGGLFKSADADAFISKILDAPGLSELKVTNHAKANPASLYATKIYELQAQQ